MKKTLFILCIVILLISCNSKSTKPEIFAEVNVHILADIGNIYRGAETTLTNLNNTSMTFTQSFEDHTVIFSSVGFGTYSLLTMNPEYNLFSYKILTISESIVTAYIQMVELQNEYAGGIVFYDKGFYSDGWRFMEVAPVSTEVAARFGASGHNIIGTRYDIGTGRENTPLIVAKNIQGGETDSAAQVCSALTVNGFSDWFLPSLDEVKLLYENLKVRQIGGFLNDFYWTSTQYNNFTNWDIFSYNVDFLDGSTWVSRRTITIRVRAIRYF